MRSTPNLGAKIFASIFLIVGLVIIGVGVRTMVRGLRAEKWPAAEGVVTASAMKSHQHEDSTTYSADVTYRYKVKGQEYTGNTLSFGTMSSSSGYAQGILAKYPKGAPVQVHYSPEDPNNAVLEAGIHGGTWVLFGVGTVFSLFGVMMLQLMRANTAPSAATASITPTAAAATAPPPLMGVLFIVMGSFSFFAHPSSGTPRWVVCAAGGMFVLVGLSLLASRWGGINTAKVFGTLAVAAFLAIFHWVSFGPGERKGTSTTPWSHKTGVDVRTPFAVFTVLTDAVIVALAGRAIVKRVKGPTR